MSIDSPQRTEPEPEHERTHRAPRTAQVVYLAEPPEGGALTEAWGETATFQLNVAGYHVYRPIAAWRYAEVPEDRRATSINRHAMGQADALVAILPSAMSGSTVVPMEIEAALGLGIPVVVVSQSTLLSDRPGITLVRDATEAAEAVTVALALHPPVDRERSGPVGRAGEIEMWHGGWAADPLPRRKSHELADLRTVRRYPIHLVENLTLASGATAHGRTDMMVTNDDGPGWGMVVGAGLIQSGVMVIPTMVTKGGAVEVTLHNLGRSSAILASGQHVADLVMHSTS